MLEPEFIILIGSIILFITIIFILRTIIGKIVCFIIGLLFFIVGVPVLGSYLRDFIGSLGFWGNIDIAMLIFGVISGSCGVMFLGSIWSFHSGWGEYGPSVNLRSSSNRGYTSRDSGYKSADYDISKAMSDHLKLRSDYLDMADTINRDSSLSESEKADAFNSSVLHYNLLKSFEDDSDD